MYVKYCADGGSGTPDPMSSSSYNADNIKQTEHGNAGKNAG
jgi:hypothetical protein